MAYQTGTAASIDALMTTLDTFVTGLTTTPWTRENTNLTFDFVTYSRVAAGSDREALYVSFRWDTSTEHTLAVYQSTGYGVTDTDPPTDNTGDSNNGSVASPATSERRVNFTDGDGNTLTGPYVAYHFFAGEGSTPYVYVVVETATGVFRHFGWGNLTKYNDWTGGEFAYGGYWQPGSNSDSPTNNAHHVLLDGGFSSVDCPTMRAEGFPGQPVASKWGILFGGTAPGLDTDGETRLPLWGGSRTGLYARHLSWMPGSQLSSYKPMLPILVAYRDSTTTPHTIMLLGEQPDVVVMHHTYFNPGDEFTVGGDTYKVFPWARHRYSPGSNTDESWNAAWAYKKVT